MQTHYSHLSRGPFTAIRSGAKTIEARIYDEKRQRFALGDQIVFVNREDDSQTVTATIIGLLRYELFATMFTHNDPRKFGGKSAEQLIAQIRNYYSPEAEQRYGVLGIELELA
jgi:ASC-1-like (ASCH) protein